MSPTGSSVMLHVAVLQPSSMIQCMLYKHFQFIQCVNYCSTINKPLVTAMTMTGLSLGYDR